MLDINLYTVVMSLPVAPLALSAEDRDELGRLARCGDRRLEERAGIVLACADSAGGISWVAGELGLSVETVRKWRSRFTGSGAAGLADAHRPGRRKAGLELTDAEREQLVRGRGGRRRHRYWRCGRGSSWPAPRAGRTRPWPRSCGPPSTTWPAGAAGSSRAAWAGCTTTSVPAGRRPSCWTRSRRSSLPPWRRSRGTP